MKIKLPNISFEVSHECNLNCLYCYNHWKYDNNKLLIPNSYKQAKKTLKKILQITDVEHITFTGGEPLQAERFLELVLYIRLKGITVTIISNGTQSEDTYKHLVDLKVNLFELPLHSAYSKNHDFLTQHSGSWEKSVRTIKQLIKSKAEVIAVIVLTKQNCSEVSETLKYISDLGVPRVMINRINLGGQGINSIKELLMSRDELTTVYREISDKARELKLSVSSNVGTPICVLNPKDYRGIRFTFCSFEISKRPITLDYTGNLRFCNHSPKVIGNIFKDDLGLILNSDYVKQWKKTTPEFCKNCQAYDKCKGGCRAASEQMGLTLNSADPIINFIAPDSELLKELTKV